MSEIQIGGQSEEEYLLRHDKYVLNTYSNNHDDLPRSSSDKDVYHERPRMMGPQKYLGENCYHCIECTIATFLATFEETPEQCCLDYHTSQKTREGV